MTRWTTWLFGLLLLSGVCVVALHFTEFEHWVELLRAAQPGWLALAVVLQLATYVCVAHVWRCALVAVGTPQPYRSLLALAVAKLYSDQALPSGGVSGSAFTVAALARRGVDSAGAFAALIVATLGYYVGYLASAALALWLLWRAHDLEPWMIATATVFVIVAVAIPAGLLWLRRRGRNARLTRYLPARFEALVDGLARVPERVVRDRTLLSHAIGASALVFVLDAATLWSTLRAVGVDLTITTVWPSFVLASMVTTLGPIPMGLGTFEAVAVATLVALGTPVQAALAGTLLLRGLCVWLPMVPGLYLARRALR